MEDCTFALQFLVDSNHIFNMCTTNSELFNKNEDTIEKEMELKPDSKDPSDLYDFVFNLFNGIIIEKLNILNQVIKDDIRVMPYVSVAILKLLTNMRCINRIKMERVMTTIKIGINPNCKFETTQALAELEHYVDILYPTNRRFFTEEEKFAFNSQISQIMRRGNEPMLKLLEKIDLSKSPVQLTKDLIKKSLKSSSFKDTIKIIISFIQKLPLFETPMNSINAVQSLFNVFSEISDNKKIEYSQICISNVLINGELYVYYYGKLDEKIAGCFSLDFQKLKNITDNNYTYYIFYFVLCCYCLNKRDNLFLINLNIGKEDVTSMFIFLENKYLSLFREKCKKIGDGMIYAKIIKHLENFIDSLNINRTKNVSQNLIVSDLPQQQINSEDLGFQLGEFEESEEI